MARDLAIGGGGPAESESSIDVSAILVNFNTAHLLDEAVGRLRASLGGLRIQVIIVDNASQDDSCRVLQERFADCELIFNRVNVGFGRANNQALPLVRGRHVLLLNTDAFVEPDTLASTVVFMDNHPTCGVLGVRLVGRDGELQPSCRYFPTPGRVFLARAGLSRWFPGVQKMDDLAWDHATVRSCDWVPGCYYLVRRAVVEAVGLFDPRYFLYYEEVDHCRAVKTAGWEVIYFPYATVVHIGGESAKSVGELTAAGSQLSSLQIESELLYFRKHHGLFGLLAAIFLEHVAAAILAARWIVKRMRLSGAGAGFQNLATLWRLARATRFGAVPTR